MKASTTKLSHKALDLHRDQLLARLDTIAVRVGGDPDKRKVRTLLTRHFLPATLPQRAELLETALVMIRVLEDLALRQ